MKFLVVLGAVIVFVLALCQVHWFLVGGHGLYLGLALFAGSFLVPSDWRAPLR